MTLSAPFGITDVALKKTCARAGIPTPERGYWAKKEAGKEKFQAAFSLRPPGMSDDLEIGAGGRKAPSTMASKNLLEDLYAQVQSQWGLDAVRVTP